MFPMQVSRAGNLYGFCPGKATWDIEVQAVFNILLITAETGAMYRSGGITDQPEWYLELLSFFIPIYDRLKFIAKANMIIGDSKPKPSVAKHKSRGGRGR